MVTASYIGALPTNFAPRSLQQIALSVHILEEAPIGFTQISRPAPPMDLNLDPCPQPRCPNTRLDQKPAPNWKGDSSMTDIRVLEEL